jgi:parvulin-like peptidyl-prolyl isomerase
MRTFRIRLSLVLAVSVALALSSCASGQSLGGTPPAATVAGTDISDQQVADAAAAFTFLAALAQQPCGTKDGDESTESACNRYALLNLLELQVTDTYAVANGITPDDKSIESAIKGLGQQYGADVVDRLLSENGLTRDSLRALAYRLLLAQQVSKAVVAERLGEQKLREIYRQHLADYSTITVDHILVKTRTEAQAAYARVTAPGATRDDFLALAKQISIDPTTTQNSGAMPASPASQYVPEFANAALALAPGEISQPVQTQFGWHVIRMESKDVAPFNQVRDQIVQNEGGTTFNDWLREQLGGVEVNPRYGRFDPESLTVVRIASTDQSGATPSATSSGETTTPPTGAVNTPSSAAG